MKALVLAAGLGTRLRPLTDDRPKALVEIDGKPLLWHTIMHLKQMGITEIVVNTHHFAEMLQSYVRNTDFGIPVVCSDESDLLLDTGGGIRRAAKMMSSDEAFLIHNVDIVSNARIPELIDKWNTGNYAALLLCSERESSRHLLANDQSQMIGWENVKTGEVRPSTLPEQPKKALSFSGIHIISQSLVSEMASWPDKFSVIDFYVEQCSKHTIHLENDKQLRVIDCGKVESLPAAREFLQVEYYQSK